MKNPLGGNLAFLVRTVWLNADKRDRRRMTLFYGLLLVANIILSLQPMVLAQIINAAQRGGADALKRALVWSGLYAGLTLMFWLLHGPARVIERRSAFSVYRRFVTGLYAKVTDMPLRWHQDHHSGGTINRVNKAGKTLFQFASEQFVIIQIFVRFAASIGALAFYSWWVAAASLAFSFTTIFLLRLFDKKLIPLVHAANEKEHHLNAGLYDYIGNIVTVLTLRLQSNTGAEIQRRYEEMRKPFWREVVINEWKWGVLSVLLIAAQAGITAGYIMASMGMGAGLAVGSAVAVFQYLLTINQQFLSSSLTFERVLYQSIDVHGVDGLQDDHARLVKPEAARPVRDWQNITIEHLNFTHHEGEEDFHHLRDVALHIKRGQKIAFIGSSGSGKTTLLTLLRGLYDAQNVALDIDGTVFSSLAPLSGFTTLVPQDSEIFENTVRYNLTLDTDVPKEVVRQCLAVSKFDEVAEKLPQGIDTDIRERGVNLSGGQKQRLALARGLVAAQDSSILLLDEPTSSVDLMTEGVIFDRLFAQFADKTIIASIHRWHLLPRFDHIVLMQDGVVMEQGSFAALAGGNGRFAQLWRQQRGKADVA